MNNERTRWLMQTGVLTLALVAAVAMAVLDISAGLPPAP